MKKIFLFGVFFMLQADLFAQKAKADSLTALLAKERTDTGKVKLMYDLADIYSDNDPARALVLSRQALGLAVKIKYIEGQSRSLGVLANTLIKIGDYPKCLEYNFQKLKLEEKRENPYNLASVLMMIGAVYVYQEEYPQALLYYYRSDSVINQNHITELQYYSLENLGDVYDRISNTDSAFSYFNRALIIATDLKDDIFMGASMTGLGHTYLKQGNYPFSLLNYNTAISHLRAANNDDLLCEATLGLASLYQQIHKTDSAAYYGTLSFSIALKDGFMTRQLDAAKFLSSHYEKINKVDSAFAYLNKVQQLNDSVNSKSRIRELQVISSNEQLRQLEIEENKKIALQERKQQLQYLFIGIFIPGFFLLTLLLSRIRIHARVIKILGILSLLIFFEYLTLLLHPTVAALTHHTPVIEMLIFVSIAAILIPTHHRFENWLIQKLIRRKDGSIQLKKIKLKVKAPVT